eukprot:2090075-Rhodomonas_salina.1
MPAGNMALPCLTLAVEHRRKIADPPSPVVLEERQPSTMSAASMSLDVQHRRTIEPSLVTSMPAENMPAENMSLP